MHYDKYKERPCPGCGKVNKRPAQTLCMTCRRQLALGQQCEKKTEKHAMSGEKITIALGTEWTRGWGKGSQIRFPRHSSYDVLDALIYLGKMIRSSGSVEKRCIYFTYSTYNLDKPARLVWATPDQANAIELVLSHIREVCELWYKAGFETGRSLLKQLAVAGTEELNKVTIGR